MWVELTAWHREIYDDPAIGAPDPARHFDGHLKKVGPENIWVAENGGKVVGMVGMVPGGKEADLEPVVVSRRYRRLGIGGRLVETVVEAARKDGAKMLKVSPVARNDPAIKFFH